VAESLAAAERESSGKPNAAFKFGIFRFKDFSAMASKRQKENAEKLAADKEAAATLPKLVPANSNPAENQPFPHSAYDAFSDGVFKDRFTPGLEYLLPVGVDANAILDAIAVCDKQKNHRKHSDAWKWFRGLTKTRRDRGEGKARLAKAATTKDALVKVVRKYRTVGSLAMAYGLSDLQPTKESHSRQLIELAEKHDESLKVVTRTTAGGLHKGEDAYGPQATSVGGSSGSRSDSVEKDFK